MIRDSIKRDQSTFAKMIMEIKDYDYLFDYMITNPHSVKVTFSALYVTTGKILIHKIMNPSEHLHHKLELVFGSISELGSILYNHFYAS